MQCYVGYGYNLERTMTTETQLIKSIVDSAIKELTSNPTDEDIEKIFAKILSKGVPFTKSRELYVKALREIGLYKSNKKTLNDKTATRERIRNWLIENYMKSETEFREWLRENHLCGGRMFEEPLVYQFNTIRIVAMELGADLDLTEHQEQQTKKDKPVEASNIWDD